MLSAIGSRPAPDQLLCVTATRPSIDVALDGEVTRLTPPVRYRSVPGALSVLVPSGSKAGAAKIFER